MAVYHTHEHGVAVDIHGAGHWKAVVAFRVHK